MGSLLLWALRPIPTVWSVFVFLVPAVLGEISPGGERVGYGTVTPLPWSWGCTYCVNCKEVWFVDRVPD